MAKLIQLCKFKNKIKLKKNVKVRKVVGKRHCDFDRGTSIEAITEVEIGKK